MMWMLQENKSMCAIFNNVAEVRFKQTPDR